MSTDSQVSMPLSRRGLIEGALGVGAGALLCFEASAQEAAPAVQPQWLEEIAKRLQEEFGLPAVWVAASMDGRVEAAVVGVRKAGDSAPASLEDPLTVASISKPMAGLWIATQVERGNTSYKTKVLEALPELEPSCLSEHRDITLGQLLTHTAGVIRDVSNIPRNLPLDRYVDERLRQAKIVVSSPAPAGSKGKQVYSNNGVTLAVSMVERVAGEPYELSAGRLYRDGLGLKTWGVWPMHLGSDPALPWPHAIREGKAVPYPPSSVQHQFVRPSGGARCTIADLVRFGVIAANGDPRSRTVLKPETWATVMAQYPGSSNILTCFNAPGERMVFGHSGSLGTTSSDLAVIPDWRVAVAAHTNAGSDTFRARSMELLLDAVRQRRSRGRARCRIALTGASTVDATWKNEVTPTRADDKVRIRVRFRIDAEGRTGDLLTTVRLGEVERRDNRFRGLAPGNHTLHFEFEMPKTSENRVVVNVDALRTAGNQTPLATRFEATLNIGA